MLSVHASADERESGGAAELEAEDTDCFGSEPCLKDWIAYHRCERRRKIGRP
jgi:hypothetical protein